MLVRFDICIYTCMYCRVNSVDVLPINWIIPAFWRVSWSMIHGLPVKWTVLITLVGLVVAIIAQGLLDEKIKNLKIWFCKIYKINDSTFSDWIIPVDTGIFDADQTDYSFYRSLNQFCNRFNQSHPLISSKCKQLKSRLSLCRENDAYQDQIHVRYKIHETDSCSWRNQINYLTRFYHVDVGPDVGLPVRTSASKFSLDKLYGKVYFTGNRFRCRLIQTWSRNFWLVFFTLGNYRFHPFRNRFWTVPTGWNGCWSVE